MVRRNWKFITFQTKKVGKAFRQVAMFSNARYGFTGERMNDERKSITISIAFPKDFSPKRVSEIGNKRRYTLNELKKMGRVMGKRK